MELAVSRGLDKFIFSAYWIAQLVDLNQNLLLFLENNIPAGRIPHSVAGLSEHQLSMLGQLRYQHERDRLLSTPFLCFRPVVNTAAEFLALTQGVKMLPQRLSELQAEMPVQSRSTEALVRIRIQNDAYLTTIRNILEVNENAGPMLCLSSELVTLIKTMSLAALKMAAANLDMPLFRWRYTDERFWRMFEMSRLSEEALAHFMMQSCLERDANQKTSEARMQERIHTKFHLEVYSEAMVHMRARPSTINALFKIPTNMAKRRYKEVHGEASTTGKLPTGYSFYTQSPAHRIQATSLVWLFRHGLRTSRNVHEAMISSIDKYRTLFRTNPLLNADRCAVLAKAFLKFDNLYTAPCRKCNTPYVLQSSGDKIELQTNFVCPTCSGAVMYSTASGSVSKRRRKDRLEGDTTVA